MFDFVIGRSGEKNGCWRSRSKLGTLLLALNFVFGGAGRAYSAETAPETPAQRDARLAWWRDARFGLFIHWGPVSLQGTEIGWSRAGDRRGYGSRGTEVPAEVYDQLYTRFNPTHFNARDWVALARAAGMKYLVFTSRHHDGFSMFDTQASDHRITSPKNPFRRDVVKELADACHDAGLRFGLYYSQPDWHHPDAFTPDRHTNYLAYLQQQMRELLSHYGQVDLVWFDGLGKSARDYDAEAMNRMIRSLQPGILINNRNGLPEDFDTPEQRIGSYQDQRPWETCMTLCEQWAWKPDDRMKSLEECLQTLVRCAGGDGNLLFNIGPMPDGRIEPRQVERLKEMGAWLGKHGESIYGTRGGPWKPRRALASTRRGNTIYLHVLKWPGDAVELPSIPRKILSASTLRGVPASVELKGSNFLVKVPSASRDAIDTVLKLELDGSAMDLPAQEIPSAIKSVASNVYRRLTDDFGPAQAFDGDPETRWATDSGTRQAWIVADFGLSRTIRRVRMDEAIGLRVQKFDLQCRQGSDWVTLHSGTTIGRAFERSFNPVSAREFRLQILDATDGPTLIEIEFLEK